MTRTLKTEESIFAEALGMTCPDERATFLQSACADRTELRAKVENLLKAHERAGSFLGKSPVPGPSDADYQPVTECPGMTIGPYKLMEQIGEGGMGLVFVAEQQTPMRRKVALKIIKPGMDTRDVIARFEAERQALALMDHPNIASVLDAGTTESGRPYFVMELVKGIPIIDYCDQQQLTAHERLELFLSVCQAVQHAHGKGIIHRDLKPSNVMVAPHDGIPVIKVIDFGVAKAIGQQLTDKTIYTQFNQMIGTPLYMSPEQAEINALDVDIRSDVYSMGVLLYELLTGSTPFDRQRFATAAHDEIRRIIREERPPAPSTRLSTLGETLTLVSSQRRTEPAKLSALIKGDLDWIVMKALEKDRRRRYETASALAADVRRFLAEEPIEARPPSISYELRMIARRNKVAITTSALVALALVFGTVLSTWQAVRAVASAQRAEESEQQARRNELLARRERDDAMAAREELRHVLYLSEMNLAQSAWEDDKFSRVEQLLDGTRPGEGETDLRGFEWHYWNRQLHHHAEISSAVIPPPGSRVLWRAALSPDGTRLALRYYDRGRHVVTIRDTATAQELVTVDLFSDAEEWSPSGTGDSHDSPYVSGIMVFHPDGDLLAIGDQRDSEGETIRFWDSRSGKERFSVSGGGRIRNLVFSFDGKRLAYNYWDRKATRGPSLRDGGVKVWDLTTRKQLSSHATGEKDFTRLLCMSDDGKQLAVQWTPRGLEISNQVPHLKILDAETGTYIGERAFDDGFTFRAVSPDGSRIAIQDKAVENEIEVLDAGTLKTLAVLKSPQDLGGPIAGGTFSSDGRVLATSNWSNRILVWDLDIPTIDNASQPAQITSPILTLPAHAQGSVRFSLDGRQITLYARHRVKTWDITTRDGNAAGRDWSLGGVIGGSFKSDGSRAVLLTEATDFNQPTVARIWDTEGEREICRFQESRENRALDYPVFSPDGQRVAITSLQARTSRNPSEHANKAPAELLILDAKTGKISGTITPAEATNIDSTVFHPDGTRIAARVVWKPSAKEVAYQVVVWEIATGQEVSAVDVVDSSPRLVGFSPDGEEFLVGRHEGGATYHDVTTGEPRRTVAAEGTQLNRVGGWSQSPDGTLLAVYGVQGHAHEIAAEFYDATTGQLRLRLPVQTEYPPLAMTWSPDGSRVALLSSTGLGAEITVWDTKIGRPLLTLNREGLVSPNFQSLLFSPDSHRLLHIADDNRIEQGAWDNPSLHPIHIWDATPFPED